MRPVSLLQRQNLFTKAVTFASRDMKELPELLMSDKKGKHHRLDNEEILVTKVYCDQEQEEEEEEEDEEKEEERGQVWCRKLVNKCIMQVLAHVEKFMKA